MTKPLAVILSAAKDLLRTMGNHQVSSDIHDELCSSILLSINLQAPLLPLKLRNYRGKVLHLSIVDLEVAIPVPFAQLEQMFDRLLCTHR